jgi:hypothetical protein
MGTRRGTRPSSLLKAGNDYLPGHQRPRPIMNRDQVALPRLQQPQPLPDGQVPLRTPPGDAANLLEFTGIDPSGTCLERLSSGHHDDLMDGIEGIEHLDAPAQNLSAAKRRQQLVEAHASAVAAGYDDGCILHLLTGSKNLKPFADPTQPS